MLKNFSEHSHIVFVSENIHENTWDNEKITQVNEPSEYINDVNRNLQSPDESV